MFDKIVTEKISLTLHNILRTIQNVFSEFKSTSKNVLSFQKCVTNAFMSGSQTDVISTDFSKAFNTINYDLDITKLK